jgi:glutathione synthase/RimK-type ligase-like ATP-grasp enzyme
VLYLRGENTLLIAMTGTDISQLEDGRRYRIFFWLDEACHHYNLDLLIANPKQIVSANRIHGFGLFPDKHQIVMQFAGKDGLTHKSVVYDAMYLSDLKMLRREYMRAIYRFDRLSVPIFNPTLPNKAEVFSYIERNLPLNLQPWLPKTKYRVNIHEIMTLLESGEKIWIKPVLGSGGRNMLQVQKTGPNAYRVIGDRFFEQRIISTMSKSEFMQMVRYALRQRVYMAQHHVPLVRTHRNRPVDFRVTIQRDEIGIWRAVSVTARVGRKGASVTNYHAGGSALSVTSPSGKSERLLKELEMNSEDIYSMVRIAIATARILQGKYPALGLLGIDIGRSESGDCFVYDCNSRPGRDILTDEEIRTSMKYVAGYAKYLIDNKHLNPDN